MAAKVAQTGAALRKAIGDQLLSKPLCALPLLTSTALETHGRLKAVRSTLSAFWL